MLPSHMWKYMSGWSNYSGMVTRYEIDESKMGNRVSKSSSHLFPSSFSINWEQDGNWWEQVKEQRVDGSCFLSCIDQDREVKVYSNGSAKAEYQGQILSKSSLAKPNPRELENSSVRDSSNKLDPMFVTGFTDAEGSFMLKLNQRVQLEFCRLHIKDLSLLMCIKDFFGVGNLTTRGNVCYFSVTSLHDITSVIIPHFTAYGLCTEKYGDFMLFLSDYE
uniref:Homing endonuclease LAGLIDADG domain-containing protein n=1 Tax=Microbotryum cf. violaceum BFL-2013 TaxID=1288119 RepID=M1GMW1_9BASI|nr:hypothetical protein H888_mgp13 [Microbotryum cf. violaceum BFL-2013]AGE14646.1 hypothetical protein [Microbotryum cf. violaceum BFL-2013]